MVVKLLCIELCVFDGCMGFCVGCLCICDEVCDWKKLIDYCWY